jgi:perosamine synthetase
MKKKNFLKLAIFGGPKIIKNNFKKHQSLGKEEIKSSIRTIKSGVLSGFIASKSSSFYGGNNVKKFEKKIEKYFNVKYAITVNSWTSGLIASIGACSFEPGDEIITSPFTMAAKATSILHWNLIPVFADIDQKNFCLDPALVEKKITKKTRAILLVDINGYPTPIEKFKYLAKKYKLKIIIYAAQSIGAKYKNKFAGTYGDIGGFSLNVHKHINTGEGRISVSGYLV